MKQIRRDSPLRMMKTGKHRAYRNIPVGWFFQAIRGSDKTERIFRLSNEIVIILILSMVLMPVSHPQYLAILASFVICHTLSWLLIGNFWVYMLDSFEIIKNPGIDKVIEFVDFTKDVYEASDTCNAILIYGSMCRRQFHIRSDLDLRIIRVTC